MMHQLRRGVETSGFLHESLSFWPEAPGTHTGGGTLCQSATPCWADAAGALGWQRENRSGRECCRCPGGPTSWA